MAVAELPYRPEEPTVQRYRYRTDVMKAMDGSEHRFALIANPRVMLEYQYMLTDEEVRQISADLFNYIDQQWRVPLWHEPFRITADVAQGASQATSNFTNNDFEQYQYCYLDREDETPGEFIMMDSIGSSVITFTGGTTDQAYPAGSYLYPAATARVKNKQALARLPVALSPFSMELLVEDMRPLGGAGASLNTYQSLNVLERRPLNNHPAEERFYKPFTLIDHGLKLAQLMSEADYADIDKSRVWLVPDRDDLQYWKKFLETVRGGREQFFISTWRGDLVLYAQPNPSDTWIKVLDDTNFKDYWENSAAHVDLQMETTTDGDIQRRISSVVDNLDGTLTINFTTALPATSGLAINVVSFLELSRFASDEFVFTHYSGYSMVETSLRTTQQ
jgi:hypothetical protein